MSIKRQVVVIGAKCFKGDVQSDRGGENKHYDSTTIFVQMRMGGQNNAGYTQVEYKWGSSDNFKQIRDLVFPFQAEIDTDEEANAKGVAKTIVLGLKPLPAPQPKTA
jgi:hypothetical protein